MPIRSNGQSNFVFGVAFDLLYFVDAPIIVLDPVAWELIKKSHANAPEASGCSRGQG
jgi:hypothetical protein